MSHCLQFLGGKGGLLHLGAKAKTDYLVLDAKLLLINMNYVIFFFFESLLTQKI